VFTLFTTIEKGWGGSHLFYLYSCYTTYEYICTTKQKVFILLKQLKLIIMNRFSNLKSKVKDGDEILTKVNTLPYERVVTVKGDGVICKGE
jgi:hypothetical protein